jgi:hypothetical protein
MCKSRFIGLALFALAVASLNGCGSNIDEGATESDVASKVTKQLTIVKPDGTRTPVTLNNKVACPVCALPALPYISVAVMELVAVGGVVVTTVAGLFVIKNRFGGRIEGFGNEGEARAYLSTVEEQIASVMTPEVQRLQSEFQGGRTRSAPKRGGTLGVTAVGTWDSFYVKEFEWFADKRQCALWQRERVAATGLTNSYSIHVCIDNPL